MKSHLNRLWGLLLALLLVTSLVPAASAAGQPWIAGTNAIVVDYETGEVYYEKGADVARPAASMTKVMSAYLVFEEIAAGRLSLDTYVPASSWASSVSWNPMFSGGEHLRVGGSYQVDTLLKLIFTESCNGSVIALAEYVGGTEKAFVQRMNAKAAEWGIDAHYADACGFMDNGNAVSPRAMAYLAKRIITDFPQIFNYTTLKSYYFNGKTFYSTNSLLRNGTCAGIDGLKTGTTSGAGSCFTGTAVRNGHRIISVVMNSTSHSNRMSDSKTLLEYGFRCRAQREAEWLQLAKEGGLTAQIAPVTGTELWANVTNTVKGAFSGIQGQVPGCSVFWEMNGTPASGIQTGVTLKNGLISQTVVSPMVPGETVQLSLVAVLPDGTQLRNTSPIHVSSEELVVDGALAYDRVELYNALPVALKVPAHLACGQLRDFSVPAAWYLDGAPVPGFRNDSFRLAPEGSSSFQVLPGSLPLGEHTLEFRVNPDRIPGVAPASFAATLVVKDAPAFDLPDFLSGGGSAENESIQHLGPGELPDPQENVDPMETASPEVMPLPQITLPPASEPAPGGFSGTISPAA